MGLVQSVETELSVEVPANSGRLDGSRIYFGLRNLLDDLAVTELTTKRIFGAGGSTATIKGYLKTDTDVRPLKAAKEQSVPFQIGINIDTEIDGDQYNDRVFTGTIASAKRKATREIEINLLSRRLLLNKKNVQIDTRNRPEKTTAIARDLLSDAGLEKGTEFIVDIDTPEDVERSYGHSQNVTLFEVLQDLAKVEDASVWVDKYNTIHYEDIPDVDVWDGMKYITKFEQDDESGSGESVVVDSTYDETGIGAFLSTAAQNQRTKTQANDGYTRTIEQKNITSRTAQENIGRSAVTSSVLNRKTGSVTVLGNPRYDPHDQLLIKDLPDYAPFIEDTYTIKNVTHRINSNDGFVTQLELGHDIESIYDAMANQSTNNTSDSQVNKEVGISEQISIDLNQINKMLTNPLSDFRRD